jgi:hypothetical protein
VALVEIDMGKDSPIFIYTLNRQKLRKIGPQHLAQFGQHGHSDYGHSDTVTVIWKSASVTHPFEPDKKI